MARTALSARAGLALCTGALVFLTSGATALVVLTGTATVVNPSSGGSAGPLAAPTARAGSGVVELGEPIRGGTDDAATRDGARDRVDGSGRGPVDRPGSRRPTVSPRNDRSTVVGPSRPATPSRRPQPGTPPGPPSPPPAGPRAEPPPGAPSASPSAEAGKRAGKSARKAGKSDDRDGRGRAPRSGR